MSSEMGALPIEESRIIHKWRLQPGRMLLIDLEKGRIIDDEEVTLYMMNAKSPCFIKDEEENYIYLILPVNFNAAAI